MPKIFISYRSKDSYDSAPLIYERLVQDFGRATVFLDKGTLRAGDDFEREVWPALLESTLFIIVIGPDWLGEDKQTGKRRIDDPGDFPRREVRIALERHRKGDMVILPVTIKGTEHQQLDLPEDISGLAPIDGLHFGDWYEQNLHLLVREVERFVQPLHRRTPDRAPAPREEIGTPVSIRVESGGGDISGNIIAGGNVSGSVRLPGDRRE